MQSFELHKLLTRRLVIILLLILAAHAAFCAVRRPVDLPCSVGAYRLCAGQLSGVRVSEAIGMIEAEIEALSAKSGADVSDRIVALSYLREKAAARMEIGSADAQIFFDLYWNGLLSGSTDGFWLFGLLLTVIPFMANDCGAVRVLLLSAKHGRGRLVRRKLCLVCVFGAVWSLLNSAAGIVGFVLRFGLHDMLRPVQWMEHYAACRLPLSLLQMFLVQTGIRLIWGIAAALLTAWLSVQLRASAPAAILTLCVLFLPVMMHTVLPDFANWIMPGTVLGTLSVECAPQPEPAMVISLISCLAHCVFCGMMCHSAWVRR